VKIFFVILCSGGALAGALAPPPLPPFSYASASGWRIASMPKLHQVKKRTVNESH